MEQYFHKGDFEEVIVHLCNEQKTFDFINADNVLEHLPEPQKFIDCVSTIMNDNTVICITVPNDFSITQEIAFELGQIDSAFWVTDKTSEHFNYFSVDSLTNLFALSGFEKIVALADIPIDFYLLTSGSNYRRNSAVGHDCHIACMAVENALFRSSMEKTVELHRSIAELGAGREISVFFRKKQ